MAFYSVPTVYNSLLGEADIPATLLPDSKNKMIPTTSSIKSVRTSSANVSAGSLALFQVNTGAGTGYLKASSVYLRGTLTLTITQANVGTWRFSGPDGVHSASALVNRLTVSNGSQMLSQLTNYNVWHDILLSHACSNDYVRNDSAVYEFTGITRGFANPATTEEKTINFAIPLMSPIFNSSQSLPLFLLNAPLTIEILFNSIADSFVVTGVGNSVSSFVLGDLQLVYEEINVSPELKQSVMSKLQGGAVWKQYLDSVYSINTSSTAGLSFNLGVGLNSCKGVAVSDRSATGALILNSYSDSRFFYDGRLINNCDLATDVVVFSELNRLFNAMHDANITSSLTLTVAPAAGANAWTDFLTNKFVYGISSQNVNDYSIGFTGSPTQTILVQTFNNTLAANTAFPYAGGAFNAGLSKYMYVLYDELLTIDANGVCSLIR